MTKILAMIRRHLFRHRCLTPYLFSKLNISRRFIIQLLNELLHISIFVFGSNLFLSGKYCTTLVTQAYTGISPVFAARVSGTSIIQLGAGVLIKSIAIVPFGAKIQSSRAERMHIDSHIVNRTCSQHIKSF